GRLWILDLPLRDLINRLLMEGRQHFVLNISGVDYVDSSGLGQLVTIWTSVRNKGGHVIVLSPTERVAKLLEITHLNKVFEVLHTETEAVQKAQKASA